MAGRFKSPRLSLFLKQEKVTIKRWSEFYEKAMFINHAYYFLLPL